MDRLEIDSARIGIIAGRGIYPRMTCDAARQAGVSEIVMVAIHDDTDPAVAELADSVTWLYAGQIDKAIHALAERGVRQALFVGQIKPGRLFKGLRPDFRAIKLLAALKEKNADTIFSAIADEFRKDGITVMPATTFVESSLAAEGVMGKVKPKKDTIIDIELGWKIARQCSDLNIGQTVIVKNGTVLAVEAFEGTDKAILRGGELGNGDVVCVKVAKPKQDLRFDVPCVGLRTIESLKTAGAKALAVQSGYTLLLEKEAILDACNQAKISLVGVSRVAI